MMRASEIAAERAKKKRLVENKILIAMIEESNAERELLVASDHVRVKREAFEERRNARKALADELAELAREG